MNTRSFSSNIERIVNDQTRTVALVRPGRRLPAFLSRVCLLLLLAASPVQAEEWIYTVRPGDNLTSFIDQYLKSPGLLPRVQQLNNIKSADMIPVGMRLRVLVEWLRQAPAPVRVLALRGVALVENPSQSAPSPLAEGDLLGVGDSVVTAAESNVSLGFADGSRLLVAPNSRLTLDRHTAYGHTGMVDTRVRLRRGRVESQVNPLRGGASRYEISTPAAVTAVRGTRFRLESGGEPSVTRSGVIEGQTEISGAGASQAIAAGFGTLAEMGKPPQPPRPLLPHPELAALAPTVSVMPYIYHWPALEGANSYRVRISPAATPEAVVEESESASPQVELSRLADGDYLLTVGGIDEVGLEGLPAQHPFVIARPPLPVVTLASDWPAVHQVDSPPRLEWRASGPPAAAYRVELATDDRFLTPLFQTEVVDRLSYTPPIDLEPGSYFWRVAAVDGEGDIGAFSGTGSFILQPPSVPAPRPGPWQTDGVSWSVCWRPLAGVDGYQFQFSAVTDFHPILWDVVNPGEHNCLALRPPGPGRYYARVRTLLDGVETPFSPVNELRIDAPPRGVLYPYLPRWGR